MNMKYFICTTQLYRCCHYLILAHTFGYFYPLLFSLKSLWVHVLLELIQIFMFSLYCKFTVAGATGARGVCVVRITVAYKQGQETAQIQSHSIVEINALDTKQL